MDDFWEHTFVNQAVIVERAGYQNILRVIAITNDGLRVVRPYFDTVLVEPERGQWKSCGHFIEIPRYFLFWKQESDWQFIPNEEW